MNTKRVSKFIRRKKATRAAKKRNKKLVAKVTGFFVGIVVAIKTFFLKPFRPTIKRVKRVKGTVKAGKFTGKFFKILISVANMAIPAYQFYDGFLKDKLNKEDKVIEN